MMHTTTSPSYPLVASIETAAAMLRGNPGKRLINRSVERALHFRKEVQRLKEEAEGWFFDIWQPEEIDEAECWPVSPGEDWHGFRDADSDHMFLDPVKVTILTPGMDEQGKMSEEGIPAALVAKFLDERGVVVEKTGPYNLLFLFSIGIDKTRAMGLLRGLMEFKRAYDLNLRVKNMLPDLYAEDPDFYRNMRIQDLAGDPQADPSARSAASDATGVRCVAGDEVYPAQGVAAPVRGGRNRRAGKSGWARIGQHDPAVSAGRTAPDAGRDDYRRESGRARFPADALFGRASLSRF